MSQSQLVVILLSLLIFGLGAVALVVFLYARSSPPGREVTSSRGTDDHRLELARRRREFLRRYPAWAGRDFQHDPASPWHTDPEFADAGRR